MLHEARDLTMGGNSLVNFEWNHEMPSMFTWIIVGRYTTSLTEQNNEYSVLSYSHQVSGYPHLWPCPFPALPQFAAPDVLDAYSNYKKSSIQPFMFGDIRMFVG